MNATFNSNGKLDDNYLACKPGEVAEGFEDACSLGMPILGSVILLNGLYCLFLAYITRHNRKLLAKFTRDPARAQNSPKVGKETFSKMEKLLLSSGAMHVSLSLMFLVYGYGTMYPTTHINGQIGDAAGKKERCAFYFHIRICGRFCR